MSTFLARMADLAEHVTRVMAIVALAGVIGLTAACQQSANETTHPEVAVPTVSPISTEQLTGGWQAISPGGDTTCSDGTPYRFFARVADPDKLLVFFQGGGACWTAETCDATGQPTYTVNIPDSYIPYPFGVFNFDNPDNPFKDHSVIFAPYCTGDVHLGNIEREYETADGRRFTIAHRGRTNGQAVLDWTYSNLPEPSQVFVTGSSAGAIPSPFYAALIANHYSDAAIAHLGDGAGGYRRMNNDTRPNQQWGTFDFLNNEKGFEQVTSDGFNYEQLYIAAANAHPEILFAEYDAAEDAVQKQFLALGGIKDISLLDALNANHADILAAAPNFRSFIAGGKSHTILRRPEFYSYGADGVSIRDWIADLSTFTPVNNVACSYCDNDTYADGPLPEALETMWNIWDDPATQYVEPFKIFDNLYYVGIDWVAAYALVTDDGIILIDTLYGRWVRTLIGNLAKVGLNPADVKYVINTHGHFDHAGGSAVFQANFGSKVVMAREDWALANEAPSLARAYMPIPSEDIVAADGDVIELGDTKVELFNTPGHTEGVLTLRYTVRDGDDEYTAVTLGGVGLNFSGVERTEKYLDSYQRLQSLQDGVSVSLPNHAAMGEVFERRDLLADRQPGQPHPFVDPAFYQASLAKFLANAQRKLADEKAGNAKDPLEELSKAVSKD